MSDEEESSQSESEEESPEVIEKPQTKKLSVEENEADLVLKKRRDGQLLSNADEFVKDLLESNKKDRQRMEEEIKELRQRNEKRKKQREIEEKRLAAERAAEDERKKLTEEGKKKFKAEDEDKKQKERSKKRAEYEKWKNPAKPNFVINKKEGAVDDDNVRARKSKEELESEKKAVLEGRLFQLKIDDLDAAKLKGKAKEFHEIIYRLESEKYDMEMQFRTRQIDMVELAERYRQANKVGKGGIKRIQPTHEQPFDKIQEVFAGAPAKILMYSKYERQKDKRKYDEKKKLYTGPQFLCPPERIKPSKVIHWNEEGLPIYAPDETPTVPNGVVDHE